MPLGQTTNFGDTLIDCVTPVSRGRNFCRNQINNLNDPNAPDSVLRYRTITGICNNIEPGQATVGASETVLPRLRRKLQNTQFQSIRYKKSFLPLLISLPWTGDVLLH